VIPHTVLIAVEPFGEAAERAARPGSLTAGRERKQAAKPGSPASGGLRRPLSAEHAGAAIGRGLQAANPSLQVDLYPIAPAAAPSDLSPRPLVLPASFDARMRSARAVVLAAERLDERTLLGSCTFEIATRARQAGVPAYAVTAHNELSSFDARILDLQVILRAGDTRALRRAGEKLASLV
jgi:hypothetical protein